MVGKRMPPFKDVSAVVRQRMARIRKTDTKPELVVRRTAHRMGYRFRLHGRDLPGTPDLVFPGRKKVIFVHGCFWHRHGCHLCAPVPKTKSDYWGPKLARNVQRDQISLEGLKSLGWSSLIVWECETRDLSGLQLQLAGFLA